MAADIEDLKMLIQNGRENLNTEIKSWIDPREDRGKAKIAKACIGLRNSNGGFMIIGIEDDGTPSAPQCSKDLRAQFDHDLIQGIVCKHSTEQFEITVHFVEFAGADRVLIEVPPGVRSPVFSRNEIKDTTTGAKKGSYLPENIAFVRTLSSNNTPSTAPPTGADWSRIMETCFNNREADIGAFIRRQLSGINLESAGNALFELLKVNKAPSPTELADTFLNECYQHYVQLRDQHQPPFPDCGTRDVAAVIVGEFGQPLLTRDFMQQLEFRTTRYSGWPPFVGLLNIHVGRSNANMINDGWESLIYAKVVWENLDFSRIEQSGRFYYLEGLRDDFHPQMPRKQHLEFVMETARVAEIIATVLTFAKEFCGPESSNELSFAFRWKGLAGRRLSSWAHINRGFASVNVAAQNEIVTHTSLPVSTPVNAIGQHVEKVVRPVFALFGGTAIESVVLQDIIDERLKARM